MHSLVSDKSSSPKKKSVFLFQTQFLLCTDLVWLFFMFWRIITCLHINHFITLHRGPKLCLFAWESGCVWVCVCGGVFACFFFFMSDHFYFGVKFLFWLCKSACMHVFNKLWTLKLCTGITRFYSHLKTNLIVGKRNAFKTNNIQISEWSLFKHMQPICSLHM